MKIDNSVKDKRVVDRHRLIENIERVITIKKIAGVALVIVLVGILMAFVVPKTDGYQTNQVAQGFFEELVEGDYGAAAEYVYFYNRETDVEPTITQEYGKETWIDRIQTLDEKGISITDYENLGIENEDGVPMGTVDLTLERNGEQVVREGVKLIFAEKDRGWKLQYVEELGTDAEEGWEKALSGHVPAE